MSTAAMIDGPHQKEAIFAAGRPLAEAAAAMVMVHGRGATAESILTLAEEFRRPDFAYLAPQAAGFTWYPYSFLAPMHQNEPGLSSGLARIGEVLARIEAAGIPPERTILLGFSQGACLALEYAARGSRKPGVVAAFAGGLIGEPGALRAPIADLTGTSIFLGVGDADGHIPAAQAEESARLLAEAGATVDFRVYPGVDHAIRDDEIEAARALVTNLPIIAPAV